MLNLLRKIKGMNRDKFKQQLYAEDPKFRVAVACAGAFLLMLVLWFVHQSLCYVSTDDAFVEGHVVPISAKVSAHVTKVLVEDNQEVKAGDLLIELDPNDYAVKAKMAKAELQAAAPVGAQSGSENQ